MLFILQNGPVIQLVVLYLSNSDLCPLCEEYKYLMQLENRVALDPTQKERCDIIMQHRLKKDQIREYYNKTRDSLKDNEAVITFDYKAAIRLGGCCREVNRDFYQFTKRFPSCFMFYSPFIFRSLIAIIVETNKKKYIFDVFSDLITQVLDGYF